MMGCCGGLLEGLVEVVGSREIRREKVLVWKRLDLVGGGWREVGGREILLGDS